MRGKNAIITGARTGIGRATVERFAKAGINIWACAHRKSLEFEEDMREIEKKYSVWIKTVYFDLDNKDEIEKNIKNIIVEKKNIDILVNNAGMPYGALLLMTPVNELKHVFEVNFFSQVFITQLVARAMIKKKEGAIINLSSVVGIDGGAGYTAYGAAKAAMAYFTKVISEELAGSGIRVNAVAPGLIKTNMMTSMSEKEQTRMIEGADLKRAGMPEEVADVIFYLASKEASFITGQVLRVDGGL